MRRVVICLFVLGCVACDQKKGSKIETPVKQTKKPPKRIKVAPVSVPKPTLQHADPRKNLPTIGMRDRQFKRGVSLGLFASTSNEAEQRTIYTELLNEIEEVGATDLSLVVSWTQKTVKDHVIERDAKRTVSDEMLKWVIKEAAARKMRVFLMPIIHLETRKIGTWRGTLAPTHPGKWWASYGRFILHYAKLAQKSDVALYSVGSELLSMETKTKQWHKLIKNVRQTYKGELTYSANWDHFEIVTFWDKLDIVGMTAYQELTKKKNPDNATLKRGWRGFKQRLNVWSMQHGHRYMFTEVGYPSNTRGVAYPWDYRPKGKAAPMLQARAFRVLMEVWAEDKRFDGLYIWNWFGFKGPKDRGYTPRGKPAEDILAHWYKSSLPKKEKQTP